MRHVVAIVLAVSLFLAVGAFSEARFARAADSGQTIVRLGFVHPQSPSTANRGVAAFWERLGEMGYLEGQNLVIEARWAEGRYDRLPPLMAEVIARKIDVLVTWSTPGAIAAKKATTTIPIVVAAMGDPIGSGLAASLSHPGGNLTGLSMGFSEGIVGKWLELLQETVPHLSVVAVIGNPDNPLVRDMVNQLKAVALPRHLTLEFIGVRESGALDATFRQARRKAQAVVLLPDPIVSAHREEVSALAAKQKLPAMYWVRDFVDVGGFMSYAPSEVAMFRRAAEYTDKVLKGTKPADLPIEQPTKFELVVNLKTAKALGITIPESILVRADEVIR